MNTQFIEGNEKVSQLYLACHTQEEIAEKMNISQGQVAKVIENMQKLHLQEISTSDSIKYFDVWNFSGCDFEGVSKK